MRLLSLLVVVASSLLLLASPATVECRGSHHSLQRSRHADSSVSRRSHPHDNNKNKHSDDLTNMPAEKSEDDAAHLARQAEKIKQRREEKLARLGVERGRRWRDQERGREERKQNGDEEEKEEEEEQEDKKAEAVKRNSNSDDSSRPKKQPFKRHKLQSWKLKGKERGGGGGGGGGRRRRHSRGGGGSDDDAKKTDDERLHKMRMKRKNTQAAVLKNPMA